MVAGLFPRSPEPELCPCVWQWLSALGGISPQVNHVARPSDCLGSYSPSDNFPVVNDTDATTLTSCFPSSLHVTMTLDKNELFLQCLCQDIPVPQPQGASGGPQEQPAVPLPHVGVIPPNREGHSLGTWSLPSQPGTACTALWHTCDLDSSQRKGTKATLRSSANSRAPCPIGPPGEGGRIFCS